MLTRSLVAVLVLTAGLHGLAITCAVFLPELGDEPSFKAWANRSVSDGIHLAYRTRGFGYDWLPLYLYVSKSVGLFYRYSGLADLFGTYHHVLTICLKLTMTGFHLLTVTLVYAISAALGSSRRHAFLAALAYGIAPGTVLATAAFGYQDAFHTLLVVSALWCLTRRQNVTACALTFAAALTKPQAAIYLGPIWLYAMLDSNLTVMVRALIASFFVLVATVFPFLYHGTLSDVWEMYQRVPDIHQWLTGCAHNLWWLAAPVPPFLSDRAPIVFGLNGLEIGLATFFAYCVIVACSIYRTRTLQQTAHGAAFLAFAFFMVVTQIHENHLYACFPFLAIAAIREPRLRVIFCILTITFAADLVLTLYLLYTDVDIRVGPVRLSVLNAAVNTAVLAAWTYGYLREYVFVGWRKLPG